MKVFAGRVAVVTGANRGIGFCVALQLAQSRLFSHVLLACRDSARALDALRALQQEDLPEGVTILAEPLTLGDVASHRRFVTSMAETFGKCDVLVNNAGMAFKGRDPTPFEGQCKPTLDVNFRGTVDFTERMLPLVERGDDPRIVTVASLAGRLRQLSPELQKRVTSETLTMEELQAFVDFYEESVLNGSYRALGFADSNYGLSKLALVAATRIWAREHPGIAVNCCCPGYCRTDMTSGRGTRSPAEGARNAVLPATMPDPPTGQFFEDFTVSEW